MSKESDTLRQLDRSMRGAEAEAVRWAYHDGLADFVVGGAFVAVALLAAVETRVNEEVSQAFGRLMPPGACPGPDPLEK